MSTCARLEITGTVCIGQQCYSAEHHCELYTVRNREIKRVLRQSLLNC